MGPARTSPARAPLLAKGSLLKRLFPCSVCQICPVWVQLRMLFFSRPCTLCSPPAWPLFGPRAIAASSTYSALESPAPLLPLQKGQMRRLTQRSPAIRGRAETEKGLWEPRTCVLSHVSMSALAEQEITGLASPVPSSGSE